MDGNSQVEMSSAEEVILAEEQGVSIRKDRDKGIEGRSGSLVLTNVALYFVEGNLVEPLIPRGTRY